MGFPVLRSCIDKEERKVSLVIQNSLVANGKLSSKTASLFLYYCHTVY